jgi:hypothetical protein
MELEKYFMVDIKDIVLVLEIWWMLHWILSTTFDDRSMTLLLKVIVYW